MRISVVIPCHNVGPWVRDALRSVAEQTSPPHEILVIDDGSTDDTRAQIESSGVPVRMLAVAARNAAVARNRGIDAATGDWIAFLDADDAWYPHHLQSAVALLDGSGDVAYRAIFDRWLLDGSILPCDRPQKELIPAPASGLTHERYIELESQGFPFAHSTVLYRRDRLRKVGGFDPAQVRRHDIDLWLRVIHGRTWSYNPRPGVRHRTERPGRISNQFVECEYFYLRALLKNAELYRGPWMDALLAGTARRAISLSFVEGTPRDFRRARPLAWPHLQPAYRWFYASAPLCTPLFRWALTMKRRWHVPALARSVAAHSAEAT